jgi:uncharacterized repeat protein (TIGR01451 family)
MCGADIALVLDRSKSIGSDGMRSLKRAADTFTSALAGTGSQASVTGFDDDGEVLRRPTDLDGRGLEKVQASYADLQPGGWTNWYRGLREARSTFDGFEDGAADLTIVVTDGHANTISPRYPGQFRDGSRWAVNPAISQANAMKADGAHVLVIAVGDLDLRPIVAISGDEEFTGDNVATAGYLTTDSYDTLSQDLLALAVALCGGQVVVDKLIDGERVPDWGFSTASDQVSPTSQKTGLDGVTEAFEVSGFTTRTRVVSFTEEDRQYYRMDGMTCDATMTDVDFDAGRWSVEVGVGEVVHCTAQNAPNPDWSVTQHASPPSGTAVRPGDQIDFTLTVQHDGGPTATDLLVLDDIAGLAPFVTFDGFIGKVPKEFSWDEDEPGRLAVVVGELAPATRVGYTFRVTVRDDVRPGEVLRSTILTNCPPSVPELNWCSTEHPTPGYVSWKTAQPGDDTTVQPGSTIEYTLHGWNMFAETGVSGATVVDDLSDVLEHATLVEPLDPALHLDGDQLMWHLPDLPKGSEPVSVSFSVTVDPDAWGVELVNVLTPDREGVCPTPALREAAASSPMPGALGGDDECRTTHRTPDVELSITKAADPSVGNGEPVESGASPADTIVYEVVIENLGSDPAYVVDAEDLLPAGVSIMPASVHVATSPDPHEAERWSFSEPSLGRAQFSHPGPFMPGDRATITFLTEVGTLEQPDPATPIPDLVNEICVSHAAPPTDGAPLGSAPVGDGTDENVCATATTPVKSIALTASAMCVADTPWLDYRVTAANVASLSSGSLIWWTPEAYANRNPAIAADDVAALLADGASQVDPLDAPADWSPGEPVSGQRLWPGAAVDASGKPIDWPGWTLRPDGTWVLDPAAPFYDLRTEAVVEVRVNPSTAVTTVYPPPTPDCHAAPRNRTPGSMASTGFDGTPAGLVGLGLGLLGLAALGLAHRRGPRGRRVR